MGYCLESDNENLAWFREHMPLDEKAKQQLLRSSVLVLREAIFAHYEINPFCLPDYPQGIDKTSLENDLIRSPSGSFIGLDPLFFRFPTFVEMVDWNSHRLVDCVHRGILNGEITFLNAKYSERLIKKEDYAQFFANKGIPLPEFLTKQIERWEPLKLGTTEDVKKIDFPKLSPSVKRAIVMNIIAQLNRQINSKIKISEVLNSQSARKFLELCSKAENGKVLSDDTIREYIEDQFP